MLGGLPALWVVRELREISFFADRTRHLWPRGSPALLSGYRALGAPECWSPYLTSATALARGSPLRGRSLAYTTSPKAPRALGPSCRLARTRSSRRTIGTRCW